MLLKAWTNTSVKTDRNKADGNRMSLEINSLIFQWPAICKIDIP